MRPNTTKHFSLFIMLAIAVGPLSLLIGCSPESPLYPKVVGPDAITLKKCKYLGKVIGGSGEFVPSLTRSQAISDEIQIQSAKARALQEASDLGATHIVWEGEIEKNDEATIRARAYKCKKE